VARAEAYLHAKFHLDPSNRLHNTSTLHTDRQTGQTDRQRFDSIGQTVLQTVAQKLSCTGLSRVTKAQPVVETTADYGS